ncbi:MAG: hypothetical protein A3H43_02940 [Gammaproteobacteria bacterium RIFCSPLOWO2_02_FULL_42_9]|nr:MAG: hypothetical protein A3H43_02940 [Gammaproteobacteria bacterium RIFCSPLOWO2_02_FULL_42_9]
MMTLCLYFNTLRYLKWSQIYWRLRYRLYRPKIAKTPPPPLRNVINAPRSFIQKRSAKVSTTQYRFLNKTEDVSCSSIWNDGRLDKLWLYNLHYFDEYDKDLMLRWMDENPPGEGIGWEPYTLSLRLVNWMKYHLESELLSWRMLESLAMQARYLMSRLEYHLLGNHVFSNAKALVFAGLFFQGKEADKWLRQGIKILDHELQRQILPEGGHFELSPMYHALILQDILDLINVYYVYDQEMPAKWLMLVPQMLSWLATLTYPNGRLAFFNDSAMAIAPDIDALCQYAKNLSISYKLNILRQADGYWRLQKGDLLVLADVAPTGADYLPGHAHADSLSFELLFDNQLIFVNSGISTYANNAQRIAERGTAAHNTLTIDDQNSSEVWASFRVARRARIFNVQFHEDCDNLVLRASHDGYKRLRGRPVHTREWRLTDSGLVIKDNILGNGAHRMDLFYHLAPEIAVRKTTVNSLILSRDHCEVAKITFQVDGEMSIQSTLYHAEFGMAETKQTIVLSYVGKIPIEVLTEVIF